MSSASTQTAAPGNPGLATAVKAEQRLTVRRDLGTFEAAIAHYPEPTKLPTTWLYQYMMSRCNGSPAIVAAQLKKLDPVSYPDKEQYVYQVTTGRYFRTAPGEKAIAALIELVAVLKRHELLAEQAGRIAFNEDLSIWKSIRDYIDRKRARDTVCKFGAIEGATGTGKTAATKHYQLLNNHGSTVRFEAPSSPSLARFLMKLGACYNVLPHVRTHERLVKIEENVNDTRTIIVENVQKLYNPKTGAVQPALSFLQELQDDTGCTIVMTWTPVFRRTLTAGPDASYFEQFISRIGGIEDVLVLDRKLPKADVLSIARQFDVVDIDDCYPILSGWAKQAGPLRILYSRLQKAKLLARGKAVTRDHLDMVTGLAAAANETEAEGDET